MKLSSMLVIYSITSLAISSLFAGEITKKTYKLGQNSGAINNASVTINLGKINKGLLIDRKFYGTQVSNFVPHPGPAILDGLQLGRIRIGGNLYDTFNWKNELLYIPGDIPKKSISFPNYVEFYKARGIDSIIQVNMMGVALEANLNIPGSDPSGFDLIKIDGPAFAAELVTTLNGKLGLGVENFSMGNEPEQWQDTHGTAFPWAEPLSADEYVDRYISHALAMREAQEKVSGNPNDIKLWGPEISNGYFDWQTANMTYDCEWTEIWGQISCAYGPDKNFDQFIPYFLDRLTKAEVDPILNPNGYKLLDYVAFHYYPNFRTNISDSNSIITDDKGNQRVQEMLQHTDIWDNKNFTNTIDISSYRNFNPEILNRMNRWIEGYYPDARLALSEFALDSFDGTFGYHPIVRPMYMADTIGRLARSGVAFFGRAFLSTTHPYKIPWALIDTDRPTDLYKMYQLFTNYFNGYITEVEVSGSSSVGAYAVTQLNIKGKESINVALVNRGQNDETLKMVMKNSDGSHKDLVSIKIPAWSATLVQIPAKGNELRTYTYGANEMGVVVK